MSGKTEDVAIKEGIVFREEDEGAFVFDPSNGRICYLNELGSMIWKSFQGNRTPEDFIGTIALEYPDIPGRRIREDCLSFIKELGNLGFLKESRQDVIEDP